MICNKDTRKCHTTRDAGYNSCNGYEDRGKNTCRGWKPWARWLCFGWYWVSNWVCKGWSWVANIVCTSYVIVVEYFACGILNSALNFVCNTFSSVDGGSTNKGYNSTLAYDTVRLSRWVYDGISGITSNLGSEITITHGSDFNDGVLDTEASICFLKNDIYIAFRGTEANVFDWLSDASAFPSSFYADGACGSKVHLGFVDAYLAVVDQLEVALTKIITEKPNAKIICTGHSLGGALAVICAYDLKKKLPEKEVYMYNFGAPAVGNTDFVNSYNAIVDGSWRHCDPNDPVPHSTPYTHVKSMKQLNFEAVLGNVGTIDFGDHSIINYENQIKNRIFLSNVSNNLPIYKLPGAASVQGESSSLPFPSIAGYSTLVGNLSTKELHKPHCNYVDMILDKNKFVLISTAAQRLYDEKNYDGCFYCNKEKHWK